ncbi:MAG: hypothetical protein ACRDPG_11905 [Nocardioidaceae bacterium]
MSHGLEPSSSPTFVQLPTPVDAAARAFASAWLGYDARSQSSSDVLRRIRRLASRSLLDGLRTSPRLRLPWATLKARNERSRFVPVAVSAPTTQQSDTRTPTVIVTGVLHTESTIAHLSTPESIWLRLSRIRRRWLVIDVRGGGA